MILPWKDSDIYLISFRIAIISVLQSVVQTIANNPEVLRNVIKVAYSRWWCWWLVVMVVVVMTCKPEDSGVFEDAKCPQQKAHTEHRPLFLRLRPTQDHHRQQQRRRQYVDPVELVCPVVQAVPAESKLQQKSLTSCLGLQSYIENFIHILSLSRQTGLWHLYINCMESQTRFLTMSPLNIVTNIWKLRYQLGQVRWLAVSLLTFPISLLSFFPVCNSGQGEIN